MKLIDAYQFNPFNGNKLEKVSEQSLLDTVTNKTIYLNPKPTANAVITVQNKILLVRRAVEPHKGTLDLPGGFVDLYETFEDALRRELLEELGLKIDTLEFFGSFTNIYTFEDIDYPLLDVSFMVELQELPDIKAQDDISEYELFEISQIPFGEVKMQSIEKALKALQKSRL